MILDEDGFRDGTHPNVATIEDVFSKIRIIRQQEFTNRVDETVVRLQNHVRTYVKNNKLNFGRDDGFKHIAMIACGCLIALVYGKAEPAVPGLGFILVAYAALIGVSFSLHKLFNVVLPKRKLLRQMDDLDSLPSPELRVKAMSAFVYKFRSYHYNEDTTDRRVMDLICSNVSVLEMQTHKHEL